MRYVPGIVLEEVDLITLSLVPVITSVGASIDDNVFKELYSITPSYLAR